MLHKSRFSGWNDDAISLHGRAPWNCRIQLWQLASSASIRWSWADESRAAAAAAAAAPSATLWFRSARGAWMHTRRARLIWHHNVGPNTPYYWPEVRQDIHKDYTVVKKSKRTIYKRRRLISAKRIFVSHRLSSRFTAYKQAILGSARSHQGSQPRSAQLCA